MKKIVSLFLALTMALSLAACGSKTGEQAAAGSGTQKEDTLVKEISSPVEIQFWHSVSNPVHAGILENLIKEFNDTVGQEKGITVVPTFNGSSSELYSNVIAAIKAGNAPDVTLALRPYVADYLQTDYVDLLQIHWPNDQVPPEVYMPVIREFVEEGKVRAIGISNHGCQDMQRVLDTGASIVSNQLPYSLLNRVVEDSVWNGFVVHR